MMFYVFENQVEWSIAALIAYISILTASNAYYSNIDYSNSNHNYFTSQSIIVVRLKFIYI